MVKEYDLVAGAKINAEKGSCEYALEKKQIDTVERYRRTLDGQTD